MKSLIKYFAMLLIGVALGIYWHTEQVKRYEEMFSQSQRQIDSLRKEFTMWRSRALLDEKLVKEMVKGKKWPIHE